MEKKDLIKLLDEIFIPIGFKRKGNNWVFNGDELSKIINLQKSNFGNHYYLNYGYVIKGLELTTVMHDYNRLASNDKDEEKRITDLLDLETAIATDKRLAELKKFISDKIVSKIQLVNTEEDLLNELMMKPTLNVIPLVVKKHFNLEK